MRTRKADTPKSAAGKKKVSPASASAETTPKSTPKSAKTTKKSASKEAATPAPTASPDPKPETEVKETTPAPAPDSAEEKKPAAKKAAAKAKLPLAAKAAVTAPATASAPGVAAAPREVKIEETVAPTEANKAEETIEEPPPPAEENTEESKDKEEVEPEEEREELPPETDANDEANLEEVVVAGGDGDGEEQMQDVAIEGDEEPTEAEEVGKGEGEDQEKALAEVDEQMEISDMAKARKIKKEQEIFVGGLDRDAVEEDVKKVFEKVGEVLEVRLHKDFTTNKNKGFAFVKFASKDLATKALVEMKNPVIHGKRCGIAPSEDNDTLFLGNICNTWTKEAIKRKLKDYGVDTVESITLVSDTQNEGLSRGFAFLEFPCHADAMLAYQRLQKPDAIFGHPDRTAKVAFAEPLREPDPEVMAQVKSVFVDGMPPYWDEDRVKEQFKGYGEIERVVLARNMSTAKRNDFGFVNFTTHEAAVAFIEGVNNTELGDGKSKVKVRARLANPLPKTQAVKGGMSGGFRIGHTGIGYSRFGRGFGRGRFPFHREGFQGGRGFYPRGRGRGRYPFAADDNLDRPYSEFRGGWRPFGARGGRRISTSARRGGFDRGHGRVFPARRQPFPPEGDFGGPFGAGHLDEDPYFYGDGGHGIKRPFSMMERDPAYLEPGSRMRPRYNHPDPMSGGSRYRDMGMTDLYSHDYYGSDYGGRTYSDLYGGESSGSGYYY
ncbi:heterogeneous nuclear ribonucleoprotein Q-like [Iris pallida]|uniref:Heterogeneous nuclear ribonucleoprotein Q-like n=1 Tax=Iris pallida TaxID=29817 RepID=A0AAX6HGU4_IRIPA|nr:heterogeneous nuclear ribonucleoprotein Q-like [Iris pallida]